MIPRSGSFLIAFASLWLLALAGSAAAQEQAGDDLVREAPAHPVEQIVIGEQNFDQWVYRGNAELARRRLDATLQSKIDAAAQAGNLTASQREKLQLAGRGDLRRYYERIEALRARFKGMPRDMNAVQAILQDIQPLQIEANGGLFGEGSLFAKTLRRTLSADQAAKYARFDRERRLFRYQARIEAVVAMLDNGLALSHEQRQAVVRLLVDHTAPPRRFSEYDQYYVVFQLRNIPDGRLEKVLDPEQRQLLQRVIDRFQGIEPVLEQHGLIPDPVSEEEAARVAPAENARANLGKE